MSENRRRSIRVAPVQRILALRVTGYLLSFLLVCAVLDFLLSFMANPFEPISNHVRRFLATEQRHLFILLCMMPVFIRDSLRFSHRFAGPIVRFEETLRNVNKQQSVAPVLLRDDDYWKELAGEMNELVAANGKLRVPVNVAEPGRSSSSIVTAASR